MDKNKIQFQISFHWLLLIGEGNLVALFFCYGVYTNFVHCVCEYNRGRIVDEVEFSTEFYIDSRVCVSDGDEA